VGNELLLDIDVIRGCGSWLMKFKVVIVPDSPHDPIGFLFYVVLFCRGNLVFVMASELCFVGRVGILKEWVKNRIYFLNPLDAILTMLPLHHVF
jgi:hypothetical protein